MFLSLTPASLPLFYSVYSLSYSTRLGVSQVGGDMCCVLHKHFSPFIRLWSSCPPCEAVLFLVVHSSRVVPGLRGFTRCHTAGVSEFYRQKETCIVYYTNTSPPFSTSVKLPSLRGSLVIHRTLQPHCLVPRRILQPRCPCFTRFYTVFYSVKLGVIQVGGDCVVLTQTLLPPL